MSTPIAAGPTISVTKFRTRSAPSNFVTEIVGPAAIGVDIVKMLVQLFREKPGNYIKVFVMVRGEAARVGLRNLGRAARRRRVGGDFEFVGTQHRSLLLRERIRASHHSPARHQQTEILRLG